MNSILLNRSWGPFCVSSDVRLFKTKLPSWGFFLCLGIIAGTLAVIGPLAALAALPRGPLLAASGSALIALLLLAFGSKVLTGSENYNLYHYLFAVTASAGGALWILNQPLWRNLDIIVLGIGVAGAVGRLGCLRAGCCYGRPCGWGITYPSEYAGKILSEGLVGIRLFPSQLVESALMIVSTLMGIILLARSAPSGAPLAWFAVLYSVGRFFADFFRLETGRYRRGLTEAQITSLLVSGAIVGFEQIGWLPFATLHAIAAGGLVMIGIARALSSSERILLFRPDHIEEIANVVRRMTANSQSAGRPARRSTAAEMDVERTSLGLVISGGRIVSEEKTLLHYCVSRGGTKLNESTVEAIARLLFRLSGSPSRGDVVKRPGAFHVIIPLGP